jgi:Fe-S-cluster containining protein
MLETGSHEIRTRINVAEANGLLLPLGLFASPEHESKIAAAGSEGFGKRPELLCPFFDTFSRGCSIWNFRPGVCTTYFCKSERGENGLAFWADLESYLNHFEWTLANAVLWQLGLTEDDTELCEAAMLTDSAGDERDILLRAAWAGWADRKETFFIESWRCALQMNGDELSSLLGDEALVMEKSLLSRSQRDAESER